MHRILCNKRFAEEETSDIYEHSLCDKHKKLFVTLVVLPNNADLQQLVKCEDIRCVRKEVRCIIMIIMIFHKIFINSEV